MRIVAGKYKRLLLDTLEGDSTRPTKDMVKEALFDSLQVIEGESFLDLFAGSGSIGIEAISRGCHEVIFNDANKDAIKIIEKNLQKINEVKRVLNLDYKDALQKVRNTEFNYIFLDPPYAFNEYDELFRLINEYKLLSKKGIIVVEVKKDTDLKEEYFNLIKYKDKKYGISKLLYYRKKD